MAKMLGPKTPNFQVGGSILAQGMFFFQFLKANFYFFVVILFFSALLELLFAVFLLLFAKCSFASVLNFLWVF